MATGGMSGFVIAYFGIKAGNMEPLALGGGLLVLAIVMFFLQLVPIPKLGKKVEEEIARLFPAEAKRRVLVLFTDGFTDYKNDGVYISMLKFSKGDMNRLKKLSRALNGQSDFRDAHPVLEQVNKKWDENENK